MMVSLDSAIIFPFAVTLTIFPGSFAVPWVSEWMTKLR